MENNRFENLEAGMNRLHLHTFENGTTGVLIEMVAPPFFDSFENIKQIISNSKQIKQIISILTTRPRRNSNGGKQTMKTLNSHIIALEIAVSDEEGQINPLGLFLEFAQTTKKRCEDKQEKPHFDSKDFKAYLSQKFDQISTGASAAAKDKAKMVNGWYRAVSEQFSEANKRCKFPLFQRKEKTAMDKQLPRCNPKAKTHKNIYYFSNSEDGKNLAFEVLMQQISTLKKM